MPVCKRIRNGETVRILVLSECSRPIEGDALYDEMRCFIRGVVGAVDDVFFEVVLPAKDKVWGDYSTKDLEHPRVRLHYVPMLPTNTVECVMMTRDLYEFFGQNKARLFYDAVLNCRVLSAPLLKKVLKSKYAKFAVDVPIFNHTGGVRADTASRRALLSLHGEDEGCIETFACMMDFMQVHSEMEKKLLLENWRKYLAPSYIAKNLERIYAYRFGGFDFNQLDAVFASRKRNEIPCLMFGGRLVSTKGWLTFLEFVAQLRSTGKKFRAVVTTADAIGKNDMIVLTSKHPGVEFYGGTKRPEFYKKAAEADLFICDAQEEPFGRAFVELQYAGAYGIYRGRDYVKNLVPPTYWDVHADKKMMYARLAEIVTKWKPGCLDDRVASTRAWIRAQYDFRTGNTPFYRWMEDKTRGFYEAQGFGAGGTLSELCRQVAETIGHEPVPISKAWALMTEKSASHREFGAFGDIMNPFHLRRELLAAGLKDLCTGPEPMLVKEREIAKCAS